MSEFYMMF